MARKYLVVDDNDLIRGLLSLLFSQNGDVLTAQNGQEALTLAKAQSFDIILTDYCMPVMNGIEFLERARETVSDIYLHSILLTGSIDDAVRSFSEQNGIPLIPKPFSVQELKAAVDTLLEANRARQAKDRMSLPEASLSPGTGIRPLRPESYGQLWG